MCKNTDKVYEVGDMVNVMFESTLWRPGRVVELMRLDNESKRPWYRIGLLWGEEIISSHERLVPGDFFNRV